MIHRLGKFVARERTGRSSEALMSAAKRGDRRAFSRLIARHREYVLRFTDGDEFLALNLWRMLWEHRASYEDGRRFEVWLIHSINPACVAARRAS